MLNLNELEKRLDEALANETKESLTKWLISQRNENLEQFLGAVCMERVNGLPYLFNWNINQKTNNTS